MMSEWQSIETAPKDGTQLLLWSRRSAVVGSWRVDVGFGGPEPTWLDNSYDDFSCGYAAVPLTPTHWMPIPPPPVT